MYTLETSEGWYTANGFVVSNCRPPDNRTPEPDELAACSPFLHLQLAIIHPRVIVALGGVAGRYLTGEQATAAVGSLRRQDWLYQNGTTHFACPVIVTYHPSYILHNRNEPKKAKEAALMVISDLGKAIRIASGD